MSHFLGSHQNRLDAKGRVSIPASFRAALRGVDPQTSPIAVILRPSHTYPCIEGWSVAMFETLAAPLETLELFTPQHDDLATAIYSDATSLEADREGRIVLPEALVSHAGLTEGVTFMGLGRVFHIWEPTAGTRFRQQARERARSRSTGATSGETSNGHNFGDSWPSGTPKA